MSKKVKIALLSLVLVFVLGYYFIGRPLFNPNVKVLSEDKVVLIPSNSSFDDVLQILQSNDILRDANSFKMVASLMKYNKDKVPAGRYLIKSEMTNKQLISKLRSGSQDAPSVVINNIRLLSDLAGKASRYFENDSLTFLSYLSNPATSAEFGYTQENFLTMFMPNTYEMFWTTTPEKFTKRMKKEHDNFWTQERIAKLQAVIDET